METLIHRLQHEENKILQSFPNRFSSHEFQHNQSSIHYVKGGSGPPLVLIHGGVVGWIQWIPNLSSLSKRFTVYAIDLPGAGRSNMIDFSSMKFDSDVVEPIKFFVNSIKEKTTIVGHSVGGYIASKIAFQNDMVEKIVLVNSMGFAKSIPLPFRLISLPAFASLIHTRLIGKSKDKLRSFLKDGMHQKDLLEESIVDYMFLVSQQRGWEGPIHYIKHFSSLRGVKNSFMLTSILKQFEKPILVLWGLHDTSFSQKEVIKSCKLNTNIRLVFLPHSKHVPNIEEPNTFHTAIYSF